MTGESVGENKILGFLKRQWGNRQVLQLSTSSLASSHFQSNQVSHLNKKPCNHSVSGQQVQIPCGFFVLLASELAPQQEWDQHLRSTTVKSAFTSRLTGMSARDTWQPQRLFVTPNRISFSQGCDLVSISKASDFSHLWPLIDYAWNWKL